MQLSAKQKLALADWSRKHRKEIEGRVWSNDDILDKATKALGLGPGLTYANFRTQAIAADIDLGKRRGGMGPYSARDVRVNEQLTVLSDAVFVLLGYQLRIAPEDQTLLAAKEAVRNVRQELTSKAQQHNENGEETRANTTNPARV